jgi:hypothetical protein
MTFRRHAKMCGAGKTKLSPSSASIEAPWDGFETRRFGLTRFILLYRVKNLRKFFFDDP